MTRSTFKHTVIPFLVIGFTFTRTVWFLVLASCSAKLSAGMRAKPSVVTLLNRIGKVLAGLGVKIALALV